MPRSDYWISKIGLRDIRTFQDLKLDFSRSEGPPNQLTVLIGPNGTGKTTLLRSIALGLSHPSIAAGLLSEDNGPYLRTGSPEAHIEIDILDVDPSVDSSKERSIQKIIMKSSTSEYISERGTPSDPIPELLVCGYGIGRSTVGSELAREYRIDDSVYTLFNYNTPLYGFELTLRRLTDYVDSSKFERIMNAIKAALGLSDEEQIGLRTGGGVEISGPSIGPDPIPVEAWADGYRLSLAMMLDVIAWGMRAETFDSAGDIHGILLIDEIEQHLHPSLQAKLISGVAELFPKMQIFATTHSPITLINIDGANIVALRSIDGEIIADNNVPDLSGYSYEDILSDEQLFDTPVRSDTYNEYMNRWRELVRIPDDQLTAEQREEIGRLSQQMRDRNFHR